MGLPRSNLVKKTPPPAVALPPSKLEFAETVPALAPLPILPPAALASLEEKTVEDARPPVLSIPDASPSKEALLERAVALGPVRMTWESFAPSSDPVLAEKRQPHIAERRARLTKMVKGALAGCAALCGAALLVSLVSGGEPASRATAASASKTAPSQAVVAIEQLAGAKRAKAAPRPTPIPTTAAIVRAKRR